MWSKRFKVIYRIRLTTILELFCIIECDYFWITQYLHVSVKYLNGEGFVATAFLTKKIIRIWIKI